MGTNILGLGYTLAGLIVVIVLAIISLTALGISIFLLIKHFNFRESVINVVLDSLRVKEQYGNEPKKSIKIENVKLDSKFIQVIVSEVIKQMPITAQGNKTTSPIDNVVIPEEQDVVAEKTIVETIKVLYASAAKDATSFYEIRQEPFDDTIFRIAIDPKNSNKGTFEVCDLATSKVLGCKDHLEGCCTYEGDGQKIQTVTKGEVSHSSGEWLITKPLHIKFV